MKAIQDQIANQLEAQRKAVADLVESQQKAFAEFLERRRSVKITDHWEARRKADERADRTPAESVKRTWWNGGGPREEGYRGRAACNRRCDTSFGVCYRAIRRRS